MTLNGFIERMKFQRYLLASSTPLSPGHFCKPYFPFSFKIPLFGSTRTLSLFLPPFPWPFPQLTNLIPIKRCLTAHHLSSLWSPPFPSVDAYLFTICNKPIVMANTPIKWMRCRIVHVTCQFNKQYCGCCYIWLSTHEHANRSITPIFQWNLWILFVVQRKK